MAAAITSSGSDATALFALTNLEEQVFYMAQKLASAQSTYNAANTANPKVAVQIVPDFNNNSVSVQLALPLQAGAITSFAASSVAAVFS